MTRRTHAATFATCLCTLASTVLLVACDGESAWPAADAMLPSAVAPVSAAADTTRDASVPDALVALRDRTGDERDALPPSF